LRCHDHGAGYALGDVYVRRRKLCHLVIIGIILECQRTRYVGRKHVFLEILDGASDVEVDRVARSLIAFRSTEASVADALVPSERRVTISVALAIASTFIGPIVV
jgi:hypothetical protein